MATNNFGDNWLSDEEQLYWGVDSNGQPLKYEQKTERQLDNEYFLKRERENFNFVVMMAWVVVIPALFWLWLAVALICKAFGYNIIN